MEIKEKIKEKFLNLRKKYPNLEKIEIGYNGCGDCFDSMYSIGEDIDYSDYQDLVWLLINQTQANFNNDGSSGKVLINLVEETVSIQNYHLQQIAVLSDDIVFNLKENKGFKTEEYQHD